MKGKRIEWIVRLALVVSMVLTGCSSGGGATAPTTAPQATTAPQPAAAAVKPIKVAVMASITGPYASSGRPTQAPINLAAEDFNKTAKVPVELLFEDCGGDNTTAVNGLNRILESNPAGLASFCIAQQFSALTPILAKENLPTIMFGTTPGFYENGWKWLFGSLGIATVQASAGLRYLKEDLGKTKVAMFVPNDDAGKAVVTALTPIAKSLGIELFGNPITYNDNDYSGNIAAARRSNPDAYIIYAAQADGAKLLRQLRQAGVQETIMGHIWATPAFLNMVEASEIDGSYTWAESLPTQSKDPRIIAFAQALKTKNNQDLDWIATSAYDTGMLLFDAATKSGGDRAKTIDLLHTVKGYQGLSGTYSFDAKGRGRFDATIVKLGPNKAITAIKTVTVNLDQ